MTSSLCAHGERDFWYLTWEVRALTCEYWGQERGRVAQLSP